MKINAYCAGASKGSGLTVLGGAGVVLVFTDDHNRSRQREFHFALGGSDQELAEVQAVRLALAAVSPPYRGAKAVLHVESPTLAEGLTRTLGINLNEPTQEARRWYGYYKDIEVTVHSEPHGPLLRAVGLAKMGRDTQRDFDSLTTGVKNG